MNIINPDSCAVVLVDYQQRLMPAIHHGLQVVAEATRLADAAIILGLPVLGTEQNPQGLGPNVEVLRQRCETTLPKMHFDACADGLLELLRPPSADTPLPDVVIAGCEAHVCLLQTTLGLLRSGHRAWVVAPACGSRSPRDHELAMQRLRQAGAVIVTVEMVLFEWLQSCEHERFKPVLHLIKGREAGSQS
jgi:nicotinamidase-related amidase